jgi:hypothetical protein
VADDKKATVAEKVEAAQEAAAEEAQKEATAEARRTSRPRADSSAVHDDNQFTKDQILEGALTLTGYPTYYVEVALRRFGEEKDAYTKAEVNAAVKKLSNHTGEEA